MQKASPFFGFRLPDLSMQKPSPFGKKLVWNSSRGDSHIAGFDECSDKSPLLSGGHAWDIRARLLVGSLCQECKWSLSGSDRPVQEVPKRH